MMGQARRIGHRYSEDVEDVNHRTQEDSEKGDEDADDDDVEEEEEDSSEDDKQPARNSREAAKYRKRAKEYKRQLQEAQQEIASLKSGKTEDEKDDDNDALRLLQAENVFIKAAITKGIDPDAAWKLADQPAIIASWNDEDQTFTAIGDSLEQVAERYPYVAGNDGDKAKDDKEDRVTFPPRATTSGKPTNGPRKNAGHKLDRAYLEKKYPALRGRGRG